METSNREDGRYCRGHVWLLWKERGREHNPEKSRVGGGRAAGGSDNLAES